MSGKCKKRKRRENSANKVQVKRGNEENIRGRGKEEKVLIMFI